MTSVQKISVRFARIRENETFFWKVCNHCGLMTAVVEYFAKKEFQIPFLNTFKVYAIR